MNKSRHIKKEAIIKALEKTLGIVTMACKQTDIPRSTYYKWLKEDEEFAKEVRELENVALDFAESKLHQRIEVGSTAATIFYLKTKGRKRGYEERQTFDVTTQGDKINKIEIEIVQSKDKNE